MPVILDIHIGHWLQEKPDDLEAAALAWHARLAENENREAVLYSMKIENPGRDVEIATIDILSGIDDKGGITNRVVPAVTAMTAGTIFEWVDSYGRKPVVFGAKGLVW